MNVNTTPLKSYKMASEGQPEPDTDQEGKIDVLDVLSNALDSYEKGTIPPDQFSKLLEQLQGLLEAAVDQDGATDPTSPSPMVDDQLCMPHHAPHAGSHPCMVHCMPCQSPGVGQMEHHMHAMSCASHGKRTPCRENLLHAMHLRHASFNLCKSTSLLDHGHTALTGQ